MLLLKTCQILITFKTIVMQSVTQGDTEKFETYGFSSSLFAGPFITKTNGILKILQATIFNLH
jgi:hypothetical protein